MGVQKRPSRGQVTRYQSINIFRGKALNIIGFQLQFYMFFDLFFFVVTDFLLIFRVRPRAQGAQESQEFSPWRYL